MPFWRKLFAKKDKTKGKPNLVPERGVALTGEEAVNRYRELERKLEQKQLRLESKIETQEEIIEKSFKTNRRASYRASKKKTLCEKQLQKVDNTLTVVESQRVALEAKIINNLKSEAEMTLKRVRSSKGPRSQATNGKPSSNNNSRDQLDLSKQIQATITNSTAGHNDQDEGTLIKEIEDIGIYEKETEL